MRIGIDARMYGQSVTGIGIYTKNLIENLLEIDTDNEYIIFLLPENYEKFKTDRKNVKKIRINICWYSWAEQIKLPYILMREKIDIMHFPHFNVPILYPKKYISTIHDITPKFFPGHLRKKSFKKRFGYWLVFKIGIKRASKIISVSQHTKNHLIKYYRLKPELIKVIYPGISNNLQEITDCGIINQLKTKYKITKPYIFYVGVWRDHKNLPGLVRGFNILINRYKLDLQLVLGGKQDPNYPETKKTWEELGLTDNIILPGFISDEELPIFYSAAEAFVLPSFNEGFGLVAVEAAACNTPVVASKTTSIPEVLQDGALYFDPNNPEDIANTIKKVITDKELSKKIIKLNHKIISKYNWKKLAKDTLDIYEKINKK